MSLTVQQVVEIANKRTERRGEKKLDLTLEFWSALQEFCRENHFWWRRKTYRFSTAIGTVSYDLTSSSGANAADIDEVIRAYRIDSATSKTELQPLLDTEKQAAAYEATANSEPSQYFISGASPPTFHLSAPADRVIPIRIEAWATPQIPEDLASEAIPLVPYSIRWALADVLEYRILSVLLGENDTRATLARQRRDRAVALASAYAHWTTNQSFELRSGASAVRATG